MHISSLSSLHTPPTTTLLRHRSLSIRAVDTVQSFDYKICNDFKITTKLNISVVNVGQFLAKPRINPLGFRLGATQSHHSVWFSQPKNYSQGLEEDKKIRDFIKNYAPNKNITSSGGTQKKKEKFSGVKGISRILIQKRIDLIQVVIYMKSPELLIGNRPGGIEELQTELQKELNCVNRKVNIDITRIANPNANPYILAEFIAEQLEKRVSCRKAMKKAIELAEKTNIKGIQVQIKGRIDGKEIARVEWIREGRVPLQTIRAKIDYCAYMVQTKYGMVGIKIWIYTDDE